MPTLECQINPSYININILCTIMKTKVDHNSSRPRKKRSIIPTYSRLLMNPVPRAAVLFQRFPRINKPHFDKKPILRPLGQNLLPCSLIKLVDFLLRLPQDPREQRQTIRGQRVKESNSGPFAAFFQLRVLGPWRERIRFFADGDFGEAEAG